MDGATSPSNEGGGIRRRHSSHGDVASDFAEAANVQDMSPRVIQDVRPSTGDSTHRVRFSADVVRKSKKRKSDESIGSTTDAQAGRAVPQLSVVTSSPRGGHSYSNSADSVFQSPRTSDSASTQPQRQSLVSPRTRKRGLSLRSSLFVRQLTTQPESPGSVIELNNLTNPFDSGNSRNTKKGPESTVRELAPEDMKAHMSFPPYKALSAEAPPPYQSWMGKQAERHLPLRFMQAGYAKVKKTLFRIQDTPPSKNGRQIPYDAYRKEALIDERTGRPFISNMIRSSKYTPWNFVPRQLFAQFSKFANFYFLVISIMQMIKGLSTTGNYTTIVPLLFFVSVSIAKEGYEDLRRHRLDKAENTKQVNVLHAYKPVTTTDDAERAVSIGGPIHWSAIKWHALQVGDIIKLERDEMVPADIILLGSKGPNDTAYIETMALDGETNLKNKQPASLTVSAASSIESLAAAQMHFTVEDPNLDLYNFEGTVTINGETSPLTNNEIVYRGSVLRNTPEAVGIVIYSGEECKIRMNANKNPRIKAPSLQSRVNKVVLIIVLIVLFLSVFNAAAYALWRRWAVKRLWYIRNAHVPFLHIVRSLPISNHIVSIADH